MVLSFFKRILIRFIENFIRVLVVDFIVVKILRGE